MCCNVPEARPYNWWIANKNGFPENPRRVVSGLHFSNFRESIPVVSWIANALRLN